MLNKQYTSMLQEKDVIFEIFQYATERAKVVGAENIYDFSLGILNYDAIVYYVSIAFLFVFLTIQMIKKKRFN